MCLGLSIRGFKCHGIDRGGTRGCCWFSNCYVTIIDGKAGDEGYVFSERDSYCTRCMIAVTVATVWSCGGRGHASIEDTVCGD